MQQTHVFHKVPPLTHQYKECYPKRLGVQPELLFIYFANDGKTFKKYFCVAFYTAVSLFMNELGTQ